MPLYRNLASAMQTLTNKSISGSSNTLSNIGNSSLTNSSITVAGHAVSLGGSQALTTADLSDIGTFSLNTSGSINAGGALTVDNFIILTGNNAALFFDDRTTARAWAWYDTGDLARLSNSSSDVFSIDPSGNTNVSGNLGVGVSGSSVAALDVDRQANFAVAGKFGSNLPLYLMTANPSVGFNIYWNGSTWAFGKGSSGNYGSLIDLNASTGDIDFFTTNSGNAAATATLTNVLTLKQNGNLNLSSGALMIGGNTMVSFSSNYTSLGRIGAGDQNVIVGYSGDDTNYYKAGTHKFRDTSNNVFATIDTTGIDAAVKGWVACTSQLSKTTDTSLATVTGLSVALAAGKTYRIQGWLNGSSGASGGIKVALVASGGLTATSIRVNGYLCNGTTNVASNTVTALGSNIAANNAVYTDLYIEGTIVVNAAGTINVQAAQNSSNGTATVVNTNSNFSCTRIN